MASTSNDDVIIVGSLSDKELRESIDALVDYVGDKTTVMAGKFDVAMEKMKSAMKDFAITQKVSVDLIQEAWKEMSSSFDAMVSATRSATSSTKSAGGSTTGGFRYDDNTVGQLEEIIAQETKRRKEMELGSDELREQNRLIDEQKKKLREETSSASTIAAREAKKNLQEAFSMPARELSDAEKKLQRLKAIAASYQSSGVLDPTQWNRLNNQIQITQEKIDRLRRKNPASMKDVLGMDENSVEAITRKMQALKSVQIDPNNSMQVRTLGNEYQRLSRLQAEMLGKNIQLTHSNNYLAQSFGYIRNRIVYALTLGALTSFTKQIYEIRGQYELLERSLGILIDNMRRGSEIFNELNEMAMKSPFTLVELATGAKQLMAYNFAEDEVVETTRRLADISAALGVPMERLVYNLGQIRAQTVLNARDARDFANAGLAIVPMLADLYTKQKKFGDEIVTTSKVYDMMSKKMVSYADVMKVITSITDEGGKFYNFQAKQAETMKVQINNLTLAWNNMLNEIGTQHQSLLTAPLRGLKLLFENWKSISKVIKDVMILYGMFKVSNIYVAIATTASFTKGVKQLGAAVKAATMDWKMLSAAVYANPLGAIAGVLASAAAAYLLFSDNVSKATDYSTRFGESGGKVVRDVESLYTALESVDQESSTYKKILNELNLILGDFNLKQIQESDNIAEVIKMREKNIQLIKEEIIERNHLNAIEQGKNEYEDAVKNAKDRLRSNLSNAITENFFGIGTINDEIVKNAPALTTIISDIVESNIELVANKTGKEYEQGIDKIFAIIQDRLKNNKALGLSDDVIDSAWLENKFLRFSNSNIIRNIIDDLKEAKEANDAYNESVNENYEAEKKAAEQGATFNDRVEQTSDSLLKAANDTDKFYNKINELIKDYSGQNIIDFLVRVNAQVPAWMANMSGTELARLASRFGALATEAKKAGLAGVNVNGKYFTTEELFERSAQYASATKQKAANEEARKSTTITREASEALKEYKGAIEAVRVAKNRVKQGSADQALVTEKEAEAQAKYNDALKKGVSLEELRSAKEGKNKNKHGGSKKDYLGEALQKEVETISNIQKRYKEYRKEGVSAQEAITRATQEYSKTLANTNTTLSKYGIKTTKTNTDLATMDLRDLRTYYQSLLEMAQKAGNAKGIEVLEKAIAGLNVEITKIDYKKITEGLNNELSKLKEEYDLSLELDANPELGDTFANLFGIDKDALSSDVYDLMQAMQNAVDKAVSSADATAKPFNLLGDDIEKWAKENGQDVESDLVKNLSGAQKQAREIIKKYLSDIDQQTKDLEYKLADTNGKIAIEEQKLALLQTQLAKATTEEKRKLLELQIRDQQKAIEKLKEEVLQELPAYKKLFGGIADHSAYMTRILAANYKKILDNATRDENGGFVITENGKSVPLSEQTYYKEVKRVEDELRKSQTVIHKLKEAFSKGEDGVIDYTQGIAYLGEELQKLSELVNAIGDITKALGLDEGSQEVVNDVAETLSGLGQTAAGYAKLQSGDIIGGATDMIKGTWKAISTWLDNSDKKITRDIKNSEKAVRDLELAYKDLEFAVKNSLGAQEIAARRSEMANKQLQLSEKERQLELEKSRKKKNQDEDAIASLESEITDLRNEIKEMSSDVANMLLGNDIKSAAEDFVSTWVSAWRQGENTMDALNEKFDGMIDNMIAKSLASKVVAQRLKPIYDIIDTISGTETDEEMKIKLQEMKNFIGNGSFAQDIDTFLTELYGYLGIGAGSGSSKTLSALQQGIQGITEDTAGALEAYMNIVAQRMFEHGAILTEIRDTIQSFDIDVQLGIQSQMLLQLQSSYQVHQAIQRMIEGALNPSGRAFMVELYS